MSIRVRSNFAPSPTARHEEAGATASTVVSAPFSLWWQALGHVDNEIHWWILMDIDGYWWTIDLLLISLGQAMVIFRMMLCRWVLTAGYWGASENKARLGDVFLYGRGTDFFCYRTWCRMIFDNIWHKKWHTHTHRCMNQTLWHCHAGEIWNPRLVTFKGWFVWWGSA